MESVTLYRATSRGYTGQWSCWTPQLAIAEAYADNPGFGGETILAADVEPAHVLDLRGKSLDALAKALYDDSDEIEAAVEDWLGMYVHQVWENSAKVAALLAENYSWVRYDDDYPAGAETWVSLETEPIAAKEIA